MKRIFATLIVLLLPAMALAANEVTVDPDITLELSGDGSTYTLKSSSQFDSMEVSSVSMSFTLSQGGRVTLVSAARKAFSTDVSSPAKATVTCGSSDSTLALDIDPPFTTKTVTVTPSGTCSSGGGGISPSPAPSGGTTPSPSGGGTAPSPAPTPQTVAKVAEIKQQIAQVQQKIEQKIAGVTPGVLPAAGTFTKDLVLGQSNSDVKRLQEFLASDKEVYPEGLTSGYYGTLTRNAVRRFQLKYGVIKNANDPGNGKAGPKTRAKLVEIFGAVPTPAPALTPSPVPTPAPVTPTAQLTPQQILEKVKEIQAKIKELQAKEAATPAPVPAPTPAPTPATSDQTQVQTIQEQIKAIQVKLIQEQIKLIQEKVKSLQQ